jgi:hypothetical protein
MPPPTLPASAYEALELPMNALKTLINPKPDKCAVASPNLLQNEPAKEHPLVLNESSIKLYAELLLHIRTVTLFASLRSFHTHATKAKLAADGASITVTHEGESATIRLPIKVQGGGDAALQLPAQPPSKDLTLRLQMEEKEGTDFLGTVRAEERKANIVPWDGVSLNAMKSVEVVCKSCQGVVVPKGTIGEWRDLPNENWAEMMDFWHCHKPDEHHLHDHTHEAVAEKKGYAAGSRLQALASVGFVDLANLLLTEQDCEGAQVGHVSIPSFHHLSRLVFRLCESFHSISGGKEGDQPSPWPHRPIQSPKSNRLHTLNSQQVRESSSLWRWVCLVVERSSLVVSLHLHPEVFGMCRMRLGYISIHIHILFHYYLLLVHFRSCVLEWS